MKTPTDSGSHQTDIFSSPLRHGDVGGVFAEICNALYEREILYLAQHGPTQLPLLRRRLSGLSYHIRKAARYLAANSAPITVDSHNASWQAKQANQSPARLSQGDKVSTWYAQHAQAGLVVCIRVEQLDNEHIELDTLDRVLHENQTVHSNKFGWFDFNGNCLENLPNSHEQRTLLKPTRSLMTAACCGHSWNHKGKISPRALTLREILLSTQINWKTFTA